MKILVVDDHFIFAAKMTAREWLKRTFMYASSEAEATRAIHMAFESGQPFDLVISDLEMERSESGLAVAEEALATLAMPYIATGKTGDGPHGPTTTIRPLGKVLSGMKDDPKIWQQIFATVFEDYAQSKIVRDLGRYRQHIGRRLDEGLIKTYLSMFKS